MAARSRVLIADDHAEWRYIIAHVVEAECEVIGYVERGDEVVAAAIRLQPDVVTLDVSMPGQSGLQALPKLREALPEAILIIVSTSDSRMYREEASTRGADDYVTKRCVEADLTLAIRRGRQDVRQNQRLA